MGDRHVFNKGTDSEMLAMDIVAFLRKWGMWQDVQIFTGGKCYTDSDGELVVRDEKHPEKYLEGISHYECNGHTVWKDLSNSERFLDMTFEGALSLLLRHHEYEDFLMRQAVEREYVSYEYFEEEICDEDDCDSETFYDNNRIASMIIEEFNNLLEKYGLWYDLCFSWSLTTYRI